MIKSNNEFVPEVGQKVWIEGVDPDSRVYDFNNLEVTVDAVFEALGKTCISFHHPIQGLGSSTLTSVKKIKTEDKKRRGEEIAELSQTLNDLIGKPCRNIAETVIDAGYIKPQPLTDGVFESIWAQINEQSVYTSHFERAKRFAKAIEAYIRGEG